MYVNVKYSQLFRDITHKEYDCVEIYNRATVQDVLRELERKYGERFLGSVSSSDRSKKTYNIMFILNNKEIVDTYTILKEGDQLKLYPRIGGG